MAKTISIILASSSPRRKEIMDLLGVPYRIITSDFDETFTDAVPEDEAVRIARGKAEKVAAQNPNSFVIGADTFLFYNKQKIGKPRNPDEAHSMLQNLSGATHSVYTGLCLINIQKNVVRTTLTTTSVTLRTISEEEIRRYITTGEYEGKAGAYALQGKASAFITTITGDYTGVIGLPLVPLLRLFEEARAPLSDLLWKQG